MSTRDIVRQLEASRISQPVPKYSTLHVRLVDNPFMVAFVRMAGESRPWGIVYGRLKDSAPRIVTAGDGRNREAVAEICEEFGVAMLQYFRAEGHTFNPITKDNLDTEELPQIWVPGERHVEMFHHLEYAYWRVRKGDDRTQPLTAFARLSGWIFRESGRTGQQQIIDASRALREAYAFPADSLSLGNLTTAVAWFKEDGELPEKRIHVRTAGEQRVSPTLDPSLDKNVLAPLVEQRAELLKAEKSLTLVEQKIHNALSPELMARWNSMVDAFHILANDTRAENTGVDKLVKSTMEKYVVEFQRVERGLLDSAGDPIFTPHPETDFHGSAAAAGYFRMQAADVAYTASLVHDDGELCAEALASGHAFLGEVTDIWNTGVGRVTVPNWQVKVQIGEISRLREGEDYSLVGNPTSKVAIREVEVVDEEHWSIHIEWESPKLKELSGPISAKPLDSNWIGKRLIFVPCDTSALTAKQAQAVWDAKDGVGAWLTHGRAPAQVEESIIDDITQLQEN